MSRHTRQASAGTGAIGAGPHDGPSRRFLPASRGPVPAAHEATHVIQQRGGHVPPAPGSDQAAEALAAEIARSSAAPHQGRVVVTPPAGPATVSQSLGAAYATIRNLANVEQPLPAPAGDKTR